MGNNATSLFCVCVCRREDSLWDHGGLGFYEPRWLVWAGRLFYSHLSENGSSSLAQAESSLIFQTEEVCAVESLLEKHQALINTRLLSNKKV